MVLTQMICLTNRRSPRSIVKEFDISFYCEQVSSKEVSSAEKTLVQAAHSSSARVKHTMGANSQKAHEMRDIRDAMPSL